MFILSDGSIGSCSFVGLLVCLSFSISIHIIRKDSDCGLAEVIMRLFLQTKTIVIIGDLRITD